MVQCPYHANGQEHKPSAGIRKTDGVFHCFACNTTRDLPEVISYCFGYDDILGKEGMKWLVKNFATVRKEERKDVEVDMVRNNTSVQTNKANVLDSSSGDKRNTFITEEELDSYRFYHEYWTERGITDKHIIELFDLGYDKQTDCITFPVRDENGNCLFVAKRSVVTKWFNYPKDVDKPLYGLYELHHMLLSDVNPLYAFNEFLTIKLYITESMIDAILLWQAGYYAIALNGTGSELQFKQLQKLPCRHYVLATDNDKAGKEARDKIRKHIKGKLITEIAFPSNIKDIGECSAEQIKNIKDWEVF